MGNRRWIESLMSDPRERRWQVVSYGKPSRNYDSDWERETALVAGYGEEQELAVVATVGYSVCTPFAEPLLQWCSEAEGGGDTALCMRGLLLALEALPQVCGSQLLEVEEDKAPWEALPFLEEEERHDGDEDQIPMDLSQDLILEDEESWDEGSWDDDAALDDGLEDWSSEGYLSGAFGK